MVDGLETLGGGERGGREAARGGHGRLAGDAEGLAGERVQK